MSNPTQREIDTVLTGYNDVSEAKKYAESITIETEQISGDDYKLIWSTEYSGGFKPNKD